MENNNIFAENEYVVEVTVKKYLYNSNFPICNISSLNGLGYTKTGAYRPCEDSPLYGVRTLGDMRQYIETHGVKTAENHLFAVYGIGAYTVDTILHFVRKANLISKTSTKKKVV